MLVGYARVSTDLQTTDGQIDALQAAGCERVFEESMSGTRTDRPQLTAALEFARENPRLRINAVEPGFIPASELHRNDNAVQRFLFKYALTLIAPYIKDWSTLKRAAGVITRVLMNESGANGVYYDDKGNPMLGSELVRDPKFTARVVAETRALLETVRAASTGKKHDY